MKKFSILTAALFVLIISAGFAQAEGTNPEGCGAGKDHCSAECMIGGEGCSPECDLGLNEEQMKKLHKMKIEYEKEMIDMKAELKKLELGMKEEMMKDDPDEKMMMKHVDKMMSIKGKMKKGWIGMAFDARKIVPADKWKCFARCHMMHRKHGCHEKKMKVRMKKMGGCSHHESMSGCGAKHGQVKKMKKSCGG